MTRIKRVPLARVNEELTTFVALDDAQPFVLTQRGKPVAVVYRYQSEDDLDHIAWSRSPRLREMIAKSEAEIRAGKGIPHDEFWRQVEAENHAEDAGQARTRRKRLAKPKGKS